MNRLAIKILFILLSTLTIPAMAEDEGTQKSFIGIPAMVYQANESGGEYTITLQILAIMTVLTVLPSLLIMMTSFTRIIVVLAILRQAMGLQQTPSNQILLGLALFLTLFIMTPVFRVINADAVQPYLNEEITPLEAAERAIKPLHGFMLSQTRENDLNLFMRLSGETDIASSADTPIHVLIPAFITSELKTAFQIGFLIFIPFLIIDLVVASILMAMGMMMLSPIIISLPFKIMLFVLIDGWALIMGTLANSFGTV
ncbi:flagellar biosynthetic protein FliP [Thalassolituus sp. HI0120]|nr:flagellar biosynthetic protein FliP [Thalassolituus sp. HI0120]